jgi:hypothetical protein
MKRCHKNSRNVVKFTLKECAEGKGGKNSVTGEEMK